MSPSPGPRVFEALKKFRERCLRRGWTASRDGDWVKAGEAYHAFLWCRSLSAGTLHSIAASSEVSICEQDRWKVQKVDYIAFLSGGFTEDVFDLLERNPHLSNRVMLYDIDRSCKTGKAISPVFREFERFIEEEYGITLEPVTRVQSPDRRHLVEA